ncbi:hypothetical protein B5S30_g674 [[Candida] boidinii]|nr:hypothetical protein B5S30_g674 [[Candida] boidinii]
MIFTTIWGFGVSGAKPAYSRKEERLRRVQATWVDLERADIAFSDDEFDDMDNTPIPEIPLYSLKSKTNTSTSTTHGNGSNIYNEPVTPSDTSENYVASPVISPTTTPVISHIDP